MLVFLLFFYDTSFYDFRNFEGSKVNSPRSEVNYTYDSLLRRNNSHTCRMMSSHKPVFGLRCTIGETFDGRVFGMIVQRIARYLLIHSNNASKKKASGFGCSQHIKYIDSYSAF